MLTFRIGASGGAAGAESMAAHLLSQTLDVPGMAMAQYYARGAGAGPNPSDPLYQIAGMVVGGEVTFEQALDALAAPETDYDRLAAETLKLPQSDAVAAFYGILVSRQLMPYAEAVTSLMAHAWREGHVDTPEQEAAEEARLSGIVERWADKAAGVEARARLGPELRRAVDWATAQRDALSQTVAEVRGDLHPRLGELLGVQPGMPLTAERIAHLLNGKRADGADILGKVYAKLQSYIHRITGKELHRVPIGYIDLCLQSDKSVGVAWMGATMAGLHAESAIILDAHRQAVDATMRYVESYVAHTRGGKRHDRPEHGHLAWVMFDHFSSRPTVKIPRVSPLGEEYTDIRTLRVAGDPHLHTHVAVPNAVLTESGKVKSFDLGRLSGRVHEFGAFYQAQLATRLQAHGIEVHIDPKNGSARISAISDRVRDAYSKRTVKGTKAAREYAAAQGKDWDQMNPEAKIALVKSIVQSGKQAKTQGGRQKALHELEDGQVWAKTDDVSDWAAWRAEAAALGWSYRSVLRPDAVRAMPDEAERTRIAYEAALPLLDATLQRKARIWDQDIRVLACRGLIASGIVDRSDIDRVTEAFRAWGVRQDGRATDLKWGKARDHTGRERMGITTQLHEDQEREVIALARKAVADRSAALPTHTSPPHPASIEAAIARREALPLGKGGLRFGTEHGQRQRAVIDRLAEGGRLSLVIGVAGSGKSAMIAPLVDAWKRDGREVFGLALAWRQTEELAGAGIDDRHRMATAKFLHPSTLEGLNLNARTVVVVDEIGQVGTRQLLELLRLREKHGFQIVALGDPKQSAAIDAGPVIDLMRRALGKDDVPEILTTIRQQTERERTIAGLFRERKAAEAIAMKRADGTARLVPGDRDAAIRAVVDLWRERTEHGMAERPDFRLTVFAPTNADVRDINAAIRERKRAMGELGADAKTLRVVTRDAGEMDLTIAPGDMLRTGSRVFADYGGGQKGFIASNGSVVSVVDVGERGMTVRAGTGRDGFVTWDSLRHRMTGEIRLAYGYCQTIHAGQGATSDEHIDAMVSGSAAMTGYSAYVSESRHRNRSWMVVSEGADREAITNRRPLNDPRLIREQDVWEHVAWYLSRQPEKESAVAFLEAAHNVRRRAVVAFQRGHQRAEARQAAGRPAMALRARLDVAVARRGLVRAAEAIRGQGEALERVAKMLPAVRDAVVSARRWAQKQGRGPRI